MRPCLDFFFFLLLLGKGRSKKILMKTDFMNFHNLTLWRCLTVDECTKSEEKQCRFDSYEKQMPNQPHDRKGFSFQHR